MTVALMVFGSLNRVSVATAVHAMRSVAKRILVTRIPVNVAVNKESVVQRVIRVWTVFMHFRQMAANVSDFVMNKCKFS